MENLLRSDSGKKMKSFAEKFPELTRLYLSVIKRYGRTSYHVEDIKQSCIDKERFRKAVMKIKEKSCPDECWCWFRDDDRNPDLPCELKKRKDEEVQHD